MSEDRVELWSRPARRPPLPVAHMDARVEIVHAALGADGALVAAALAAGAAGLVVVLLGAGHAPPPFVDACRAAAAQVPVVACVRPESGRMLRATYGFTGAERDVRAAGLIPAPALSPAAARIVLIACLGAGHGRDAIAAAFAGDDP